ncbi:hypothetical protein N1851_017216 [Merluccius polli]|uniref:Uncharacterized protein n=1 Tax=Merluccius polli TaxID=89951 RepID=A0AA47NZ78_MERPO|nr:hypothetical protein N1851_017216 [Merluccius polli]
MSIRHLAQGILQRYRFTSQSIIYIHNLIRPYICNITNRSHALTSQQILCVALRFFANGCFLYNVGDAEHLSKATVWRHAKPIRHARGLFPHCLARQNVACDVNVVLWPDPVRRHDAVAE